MDGQKLFGEILCENGFLEQAQLDYLLAKQKDTPSSTLGQLCIDEGLLTRVDIQHLLKTYGKRIPLGQMLVESNIITVAQLEDATQLQKRKGGRIGDALVELRHLDDVQLCEALAKQHNIPIVLVANMRPTRGLRGVINPTYAAQREIVPISRIGRQLTLALVDPNMFSVAEELAAQNRCQVHIVLAPKSHVLTFFRKLYGKEPAEGHLKVPNWILAAQRGESEEELDELANSDLDMISPWEDMDVADDDEEFGDTEDTDGIEVLETDVIEETETAYSQTAGESPLITTIVQTIISRALALRSSDIHLERGPSGSSLRFRIDGLLHRFKLGQMQEGFQKNYRSVIARFKILSQMNITEKRRPQDGSFRMLIKRDGRLHNVDFRLSTVPGRFGEGMVIRLLDQRKAPRSLEGLGLSRQIQDRFGAVIGRPTGIVLVTGPTGSGKSSTLYAALRTIANPRLKILTAEDPIEYTHPGIFQTEVRDEIGNTFARYLRSFLRQDPDVIMVGEIRDSETAEMALRAAQTGHLLLSTLHSINSTASIQRLLDLHMEPSAIISTLNGVMAQRLLRLNCKHCLESYTPDGAVLADWFVLAPHVDWKRGRGCARCNQTGFNGRAAINEFWVPTDEQGLMINRGLSSGALRNEVLQTTPSLAEDALQKVFEGRTTLEEAMRAVPFEDVRHVREFGPERALKTFEESRALPPKKKSA